MISAQHQERLARAMHLWDALYDDHMRSQRQAAALAAEAECAADQQTRAWALLTLGFAYLRSRQPNEAQAALGLAQQLFEHLPDARGKRLTELSRPMLLLAQGQAKEAAMALEPMISAYDLNSHDPDNAHLLYALARAYHYSGEREEAVRYYYAGLHLAEVADLPAMCLLFTLALSALLVQLGDYGGALELIDGINQLQDARVRSNEELLFRLRNNYAISLISLGEHARALREIDQLLAREIADEQTRIGLQANRVECLLAQGKIDDAASTLAWLTPLAERVLPIGFQIEIKGHTAKLAALRGDHEQALAHWLAAMNLLETMPDGGNVMMLRLMEPLADAHATLGHWREAYEWQRHFFAAFRRHHDLAARARLFMLRLKHGAAQAERELDMARRMAADQAREVEALSEANAKLMKRLDRLVQSHDVLEQESRQDALTGLYNRRHLDESLDELVNLAGHSSMPLAVVLVDLDYFKSINDRHGHAVGDQVLRAFGELARKTVRGSDLLARYGGEEFCFALAGCGRLAASDRLAGLLSDYAELSLPVGDGVLSGLSFSAGVAVYPEDGVDCQSLLLTADRRLYQAKRNGRNQVLGWDQDANRG